MVIAAKRREKGRIDRLQLVFMRIGSVIFLALALQIWMKVTGVAGDGGSRFDIMPDHWRFASSVLCVLLPVAALGLWVGQAWGAVLWIAAACLAFAMHGAAPELFGRADLLLVFHVTGLLTLAAFRAALLFFNNKK